jgi:hypothetical protein
MKPSEGQLHEQSIHVLEAAKHNAQVVLDQLTSLDNDHATPHIKAQLQAVIANIDTELKGLLNG